METTATTSQLIAKNGAVWSRPSSSSGEQADNDDDGPGDLALRRMAIPVRETEVQGVFESNSQ